MASDAESSPGPREPTGCSPMSALKGLIALAPRVQLEPHHFGALPMGAPLQTPAPGAQSVEGAGFGLEGGLLGVDPTPQVHGVGF